MTAHQSWKSQNPGYEVHYFDMILARRYLAKYFNPVFLRAFDCIEAFAGKTNLIRLAIIYREGGWYSDWKQVCMQEKLLDKLSAWKAEEGVFFRSKWGEEKGQRLSTQNAFFGAAPKNPVVEKALGKLLENVQGEYYGNFPTQATGTGVFGWAFQMVKKRRQREYKSPISPAGFFDDSNYFYVNDTAVVLHKCENCGNSRGSWHHGNDYIKLYNDKQYYCQAAPSIFAF